MEAYNVSTDITWNTDVSISVTVTVTVNPTPVTPGITPGITPYPMCNGGCLCTPPEEKIVPPTVDGCRPVPKCGANPNILFKPTHLYISCR